MKPPMTAPFIYLLSSWKVLYRMASNLGVSIGVSAVVGGALSGFTNVGKAMDTLKETTGNMTAIP